MFSSARQRVMWATITGISVMDYNSSAVFTGKVYVYLIDTADADFSAA